MMALTAVDNPPNVLVLDDNYDTAETVTLRQGTVCLDAITSSALRSTIQAYGAAFYCLSKDITLKTTTQSG